MAIQTCLSATGWFADFENQLNLYAWDKPVYSSMFTFLHLGEYYSNINCVYIYIEILYLCIEYD